MEISVRSDYARLSRMLSDLQREQLPYATARALNDTALAVRDAIRRDMPQIFDRPTPFTQRAVVAPRELAATKTKPSATVTLQPLQAAYLLLEETGGTRTPGMNTTRPAAALVEPGKIPLDRFGNIPFGALARLTKQAKAESEARATRRAGKLKGRKRAIQLSRDAGIFYTRGGTPQAHGRPGGFFRRLAGHRLARLTGFGAKAEYRPRFNFRGRVEHEARDVFANFLVRRLMEATKTAK